MKIAPIIHAIKIYNSSSVNEIQFRLVHTGQHYDRKMSVQFFEQLGIPEPDINLNVGSGTQAEQTAKIMTRYEKSLEDFNPDACLVVGDVTSTMACALVAKKACMRVIHVEAGIRSGDLTMPEEINRLVTDRITDVFFTTSRLAGDQLLKEGFSKEEIHLVGNTMIDTLFANRTRFIKPDFFDKIHDRPFIVGTLHRPSNVDDPNNLKSLLQAINDNLEDHIMIFPMHPRTKKSFDQIEKTFPKILVVDPMGYLEFMYLILHSQGVITDSGGITEETTVLGVPCLTLRDSTERPETITTGTNVLGGTTVEGFIPHIKNMVAGNWKKGGVPPYWDGKTAQRIVAILTSEFLFSK